MFDAQDLSAQSNLGTNSDLAFVDATLPDYQSLITGFKSDTKIYILDPTGNELDQMSQILEQQSGVAGVHIFSHGSEGSLQFGETRLNSVDLSKYAEDLQRWKQALIPGADILFYGCNVAQGEQGKDFVEQIHQLTGADVAGSDDLTGNATQGGNWDLEFSTGTIETLSPLDLPAVEAYEYVLATPPSHNINYTDFSSLNGLTINGTAGKTNNVLNLTPAAKNQVGSAFYNTPIGLDANTYFNTHFQFQLSGGNGNNGADGFTFLLQNSTAGVKALGDLGGSLGYGNQQFNGTNQILKSLAIEFDTYKNSWDANNNHIAVLLNGDVTSPKAIGTPSFQLNSGAMLDAWVDYDGSTNNLNVYVGNDTVKPLTALLNYNVDLTGVVGSQAYVGFSGGTGAFTNSQNIDNWTFSSSNNINYADFSSLNGLTINGTAGKTNNALNLTTAAKNQVGSAFYNTPIGLDANTSFDTHFQFQLSGGNGNNGADGFTFLLQNSTAGVKALGDLGGSLGYGNQQFNGTNQILKSLAIEFDTYKNSWDANNNHVAVLLNGDVTSPKAIGTPSFQLNSGAMLDAWVDYDGSTNNLSVYVGNDTVKPLTALLNYKVDLTAVIGSQAYVGFSAGTGALTNSQNIDNWTFSTSNQTLTAGTFSFSQPAYSVNENDKAISVSVIRTDGSTGAASVNYATSDRTAKAGVDYISTKGVLNFIDGQTNATITIPVLDDNQLDPNLAFVLTLSNPTDGTELGLQKTSVITLLDDDASAVANVTTQHNDNNRTGADLNESLLNTTNVNANQFGKLFSRPVDGSIYAQPLYLANINIPNQGTHNVVYVATMHNTVYAFDADDPNASTPLWSTSLGPSVTLPDPNIGPYPNYRDISTEVGILSTPVISTTNNTLYVVAFTKEAGKYIYKLHGLDLTTGAEKFGGPVVINGSVPGTGDGSVNGVIAFTPNRHNQRPGLLLSDDKIYIAFASFGDKKPYHGWVFGYDATTLNQTSIYNDTPNGGLGGIWQSGNGLSADKSGNIYLSTGNGTFRENGSNLGNSVVKFNPDLKVTDWFTPYNYARLNAVDDDLGSGGPLLIPNSNYLIAGGKEGKIYVLDRNNLGKFKAGGDTQIIQSFQAIGTAVNGVKPPTGTGTHNIHGTPIYWDSPNGPQIYLWGENDWARAYSFNGSTLNQNPIAISTVTVPPGMPGAMLSLSANGSTDETGILWTSSPFDKNANQQVVTGILRAFDATTMTELWNSKQNITRDDLGNFAKFSPPTIANGKVYASTFSGYLQVYGLLT